MKIEVGEYKTRCGQRARVLMVDGGGNLPLIGAIMGCGGGWMVARWRSDGRACTLGSLDIYDLILTRRFWVPVYADVDTGLVVLGEPRKTKENARAAARRAERSTSVTPVRLLAIVPIEFAEGDGLEAGE